MKEKLREQFICCMFAVILFLSGMCVELPHADASFLYASESSLTGTTGSVFRDGSIVAALENVCVLSTLRRDTTTILSSNRMRSTLRRLRDVVALVATVMLLFYLFCFGRMTGDAFWKLNGSQATIVRYIQETDGKK